jgi:hypothetical protein
MPSGKNGLPSTIVRARVSNHTLRSGRAAARVKATSPAETATHAAQNANAIDGCFIILDLPWHHGFA